MSKPYKIHDKEGAVKELKAVMASYSKKGKRTSHKLTVLKRRFRKVLKGQEDLLTVAEVNFLKPRGHS